MLGEEPKKLIEKKEVPSLLKAFLSETLPESTLLRREATKYDRFGYYRNPNKPNAEAHNILSQMFEILGQNLIDTLPDISTRTLAIDHLIKAFDLAHVALEQEETVRRNARGI